MEQGRVWSIPADAPEVGRLYKHYKGDFYRVITTCRLSEDRNVVMVVYRSLRYGNQWARPLDMWSELVPWPDGEMRPRFTVAAELPALKSENKA